MSEKVLLTPVEFITFKAGGMRRAARLVNQNKTTFWSWKKKGRVPSKWQQEVIQRLERDGIKITPKQMIYGEHVNGKTLAKKMPWLFNDKA